MGRPRRIVVPGLPHHVTQRGNRNLSVFANDADRLIYLSLVRKYAERHRVAIWSYCLMTNHVHFVLVPQSKQGLSNLVREAHSAYSVIYNRRQGIAGHLWQARFYSSVMDEPHLWAAVRYVERNPVRAGIAARSEEYPWSSATAHCEAKADALVSGEFPIGGVVSDWRAWLADEDVEASNSVRTHTRLGWPCGSTRFAQDLQAAVGQKTMPGKRGPKHKRTLQVYG